MRYAALQRQCWLKNRAEPFNRKDLMEAFGISMPQASADIKAFTNANPNVFFYDNKKRIYSRVTPLEEDTLPCVSCEKPSTRATPDGADMCHECFGDFNAHAYDELHNSVVDILARHPEYRKHAPVKEIAEAIGFEWELTEIVTK